jgi:ferredoxin-NADP reductase
MSHLQKVAGDVSAYRAFLCGPNEFMESFRAGLIATGLPDARIHTEQFHKAKTPVAVT